MTAAKIDNLILQNQLELRVAQLEHVNTLLQDNNKYLMETEPLVEAGRLATTIAHEIKTPLVTISGYAMRAMKEHRDGKAISRDLNVMVEEISRLEELASGVLDFSKKRKLTLETLDLNVLINETLDIMADRLSYGNIEVVTDLCDRELSVKVDRDRMKQVLFNLIDNAMQAMPNGGKLDVSTGTNASYRWFKIIDTGCGMSKETIEQLFKPFYTTRSAGCGLGLPVSKRIVDDHGGFLEVESIPGRQSVFTVNLPATDTDK
jgi:signal transduction histidine kinase